MPLTVNVNDLSIKDAAKYYSSIGIITHPIHSINDNCTSPGKSPIPFAWSKRESPYTNEVIDDFFKNDKNIGFLCGMKSNLLVLDIDWYRKGIWEGIFDGVDTSGFVKASHTEEKYHLLFQYCKGLKAGQYKAFGFDILSDDPKMDKDTKREYLASDNCVCAPSMHKDGNRYQITGNLEDRPEVHLILIKRISKLIEIYNDITKKILPKCRNWFRKLWKALFELKEDELYHQTDIFYGDMENRIRCLHFCAELKANGAEDSHLHIICMLLFADRYNYEISDKEIKGVNEKPATTGTIKEDPYFSRFYTEPSNPGQGKKKTDAELAYEEAQSRYEDQRARYEAKKALEEEIEEISAEDLKELIKKQHDNNRIPDLSKILPEDHFLNIYPEWMSGLTDTYYEYQVCGGFWLLSAVTQGRAMIELKQGIIKPNTWFMFIGRSTKSRKSTAINNTGSMWAAVADEILNNDDFSLEGYLETLSKKPVNNFIRDEAAGLLVKYKQKYNDGIFDAECTLFDGKNYKKTLSSKGKRDPQTFEIRNPYITHCYATTPDRLQGSLALEDFASGYGIRFLYAYPTYPKTRKDIDLQDEEDAEKWGAVVTRLKRLYNHFNRLDNIKFKITPEALSTYNNISGELENITDNILDGLLDSAAGRAQDYILKLAMLLEIGKGTPSFEITEESIELASLLVINFFLPCFTSIRDLLYEDVKHNLIEKMLKIFRNKNGVCTKSELITLGHFLKTERDSALEALVECGAVEKRKKAESSQVIYILKSDNKPKIEIDRLSERFQNLEFKSFSKFSRFSKLSSLSQDKEYSAKFAKNENIMSNDNEKSFSHVVMDREVVTCLTANSAKNAKNAKFEDGNQDEQYSKENLKDLPQLRKDLKTFESTYLRNHGGIESIEVFVGGFLKDCPGYGMLFQRQAIIYEAGKICKVA